MFFLPIISSLLAILFALFSIKEIKKKIPPIKKEIEIQKAIREGAIAYLKRQYQTIALLAIVIFVFLSLILGFKIGLGFLIGAVSSAIAGIIGMLISTEANLKVARSAKFGLEPAFRIALKGGAVTGFLVVGLALLAISLFYFFLKDLKSLIALGFGGSLVSVFARLGGGIYTKAADVGADLVGKIEKQIPEDDPRNPAVIADLVGDNVGDCAGMAADLFETYLVTLTAGMVLGALIFPQNETAILFPLILASLGIISSILGTFFMKFSPKRSLVFALYKGLISTGIFSTLLFFFASLKFAPSFNLNLASFYLPLLFGILITFFIFQITDYYTSKKYRPVKSIAFSSKTGHGTNVITGISVGFESTILPTLLICLGIFLSFKIFGMYGLAICVISMLSFLGLIVSLDSYGPITDNASGIAEMSHLSEKIREKTDSLDAVGNTTKATTKGYAIASAGLSALILFSAYIQELKKIGKEVSFSLSDPLVLIGLFLGGVLAYLFSSLAIKAVGKSSSKVVEEVRKQFREIKGLIEGKARPNYFRCVDIVTRSGLKEMTLPALLPVFFTIFVGLFLGASALGGLLIGSIAIGLFLAIFMATGGAAWDNAKKWIEEGHLGGKGSLSHQAAVTGDTVGDPLKDTAGPAINPMIKVINVIAILLVPFL